MKTVTWDNPSIPVDTLERTFKYYYALFTGLNADLEISCKDIQGLEQYEDYNIQYTGSDFFLMQTDKIVAHYVYLENILNHLRELEEKEPEINIHNLEKTLKYLHRVEGMDIARIPCRKIRGFEPLRNYIIQYGGNEFSLWKYEGGGRESLILNSIHIEDTLRSMVNEYHKGCIPADGREIRQEDYPALYATFGKGLDLEDLSAKLDERLRELEELTKKPKLLTKHSEKFRKLLNEDGVSS